MKNTKWLDIEFEIVLYLYFNSPRNISRYDERVTEIRERLYDLTGIRRTNDSIYYRLMNYRYCDPNEEGKGLKGGYEQCIKYWDKYINNKSVLSEIYHEFINKTENYKAKEKMKEELQEFINFENSIKEELINISPEKKDAYFESLVNIRNPQFQQTFKHNLKVEFNNKCVICKLNDFGILIASHILAYSNCDDKYDMINHNNGLLLCPNHDSLFDKHLISFDNKGNIMINKNIPEEMYDLLKLNKNYSLPNEHLNKERMNYLNKHREIFNIINR